MAKILFSVIPAMGHINPTLPLAVELKKRGHQVGYATGSDFHYTFESEGLLFFPAGPAGLESGIENAEDNSDKITDAAQKMLKYKGMLSHFHFFKLLLEVDRESIDALLSVVEQFRPDVIVADSLTHSGAQMAELFKLPWATFSSLPGLIPSSDAPPFTTLGIPPSDNPLRKSIQSVIRFLQHCFFRLFDRSFNQVRSSLGLAPVKECVINSCLSPYLILSPTCEGFEYKRSDWPAQVHLIGPAPWGKSVSEDDASEWIDALPDDKTLIYVTLGTVQVFRSLKFFKKVIEALKDEPYQVVMSVGQAVDMAEFDGAPGHFRFERFVPHAKILSRATAVIHHGGQGIAQDCIYHGLPSVVVPVSQDHYEIARRCTVAGVSLGIPYPRLTPKRLRDGVKKVLNDATIKENTKRLQTIFLKTNAGFTGATLLEKLAETKAPVYRV